MNNPIVEEYSKGLKFRLAEDKKSYILVGIGKCEDDNLLIPETYRGLPVTEIGFGAFTGNDEIESVDIPDSVTVINAAAFSGCTWLADVFLGANVKEIGMYAFSDCNIYHLEIPDSVKFIGAGAFINNIDLKTVVLPDDCDFIEHSTDELEENTFDDGVKVWCKTELKKLEEEIIPVKLDFTPYAAAQDMISLLLMLYTTAADVIKSVINDEVYQVDLGWSANLIARWGQPDRTPEDYKKLDNPVIEVELTYKQLCYLNKVINVEHKINKVNFSYEEAITYFLITKMKMLGYHV